MGDGPIKTGALSYALSAAERKARRDKLLSTSLAPKDLENAIDPRYALGELRARESPRGKSGKR